MHSPSAQSEAVCSQRPSHARCLVHRRAHIESSVPGSTLRAAESMPRSDAMPTHARRQRLVSLPTMNVQRQPHGFHDAVRLHATLCVVCGIVHRCCAWCATHLSAESYNADAVAFGRPRARHLALFPLTARRSADVLCRRTKPTTHNPLLPT